MNNQTKSKKREALFSAGKTLLKTMKRRGGSKYYFVVVKYTGFGWENYPGTGWHKTEQYAQIQLQKLVRSNPHMIIDEHSVFPIQKQNSKKINMKRIASTILLIFISIVSFSQPIIALGMSKNAIIKNMSFDKHWKLANNSKFELCYINDTSNITFTYKFVKDSPAGINKTCIEMIVDFKSERKLQEYISLRLAQCRIKPNNDDVGYTLTTDLYNTRIYVYVLGNKRLIIKY